MVESDVSEDDEGEFDTTFEQVTQPQVEYWISECVKYWQKHLAFGQGANIWLCPMCPTKVVAKSNIIHHMVRHHRREATSVASNGSSKKRDIARLPFKKPGAKCLRKNLDLVHGTRNRKQRVHMKSKWNRRQIEGAVLELFHDKTIDTHWSDLQLSPSWEPQREAMAKVRAHGRRHHHFTRWQNNEIHLESRKAGSPQAWINTLLHGCVSPRTTQCQWQCIVV